MKELYPWQVEVWQQLVNLRQRLPHALLLRGAAGIGKSDLALMFAQAMLCSDNQENGMPCGSCPSCHLFSQDSHPDFRLLQPELLSAADDEKEAGKKLSREITVDQVRALPDFINLSTHMGGYRVVVITPAESLNSNSANALLKTLEEPTSHVLFILVSHNPQHLLPTILSRCLALTIPTPSQEMAISWLDQQGVANPSMKLAAAGFSPLLALRSEDEEKNESNQVLLEALKKAGKLDAIALADQLQRSAPSLVTHLLQQWCYDLSSFLLTRQVRYFGEHIESIEKLSKSVSTEGLLQFIKELQIARRDADHPLNQKLHFEALFLGYAQLFVPPSGPRG